MSSKAEPPTTSAGPLQGIRILDLSASGPAEFGYDSAAITGLIAAGTVK